ncbi:hypothetical protein [Trichlorobacter lovleyi]|uniref:hypothetical protein n=1 Tax=Trichlorobacter lovleyi TaxID=313985 RepID=UPI0023F50930|nr:hypothetical protein [Trichlorobacter lovleyi]
MEMTHAKQAAPAAAAMTTREAAIRLLEGDTRPWAEGEPFTVRFYQPEDGYGVARLIYAVYGNGYPIDTFYIPEQLTEENRAGRIKSVVARTSSGEVICHFSLHRSSAPNPDMYEAGLGLTHPAYRACGAFERCFTLLFSLVENNSVTAIFGEAVCNHTITQKMAEPAKLVETALEVDLMPADTYAKERASDGRVSCLMYFRIGADQRRPLCIPDCYAAEIRFMMEGITLERELLGSSGSQSLPADSELQTESFSSSGVCRCSIIRPGQDLAGRLAALEDDLRSRGYALLECFVPLGVPEAAYSVAALRTAGFFLGGFLPCWFGDDGLLMLKLFGTAGFDSIKLFSERGKAIMAMVRADWARACGHGR